MPASTVQRVRGQSAPPEPMRWSVRLRILLPYHKQEPGLAALVTNSGTGLALGFGENGETEGRPVRAASRAVLDRVGRIVASPTVNDGTHPSNHGQLRSDAP